MRISKALILLGLSSLACSTPPEEPVNQPPTVTLEGDAERLVDLGNSVELVAVGADPEGAFLSYAWKVTRSPDDSTPSLTGAAAAQASFTPDVEGEFELEVTTSDGELESAPARVKVTAVKQPFIAGELTVTVVDYDTGAPLEGAKVRAGELSATTDAQGRAVFEDEALEAPVDLVVTSSQKVEVDHDADPETAAVERPAWRGVTILGARRAELTVPMRRSGASLRAAAKGTVKGSVDPELWLDTSLWGEAAEITPMLAFSPTELTSGQLRAMLIAPVVKKPISELAVSDLMGRPKVIDANLPANLVTDDEFLNSVSSLMGVPAVPGGGKALTHFEVDAPAGKQLFFVMGALVGVDASALAPMLAGGNVDPASLFGALDFTVLFVGLVSFDVPEGETLSLEAPLSVTSFEQLWKTEASMSLVESEGPFPLDPSLDAEFERAVVVPARVATAKAPARLADPRVAGQLPARARVEIKQADGAPQNPRVFEWLDVPEETGDPATDVPYALSIAAVAAPGGVVPIGLGFTRVGDLEKPASSFALPTVAGDWKGAPVQAVTLVSRGIAPEGEKLAYGLLPGASVQVAELSAGVALDPGQTPALPLLTGLDDIGLKVAVECTREDETSTEVQSARAFTSGLDTGYATLSSPPAPTVGSGTHLVHAVYAARKRIFVDFGQGLGVNTALADPLWDVYVEAASAEKLALPPADLAPFASFEEMVVEVRAESFGAALDMERWSGDRVRQGPRTFASDVWLAFWQ